MIGVLGAGQLGRMLALAGYPLGLRFRFLDPAHEAPVKDLAEFIRADFGDFEALQQFASGLEVITYEFENVPVDTVRRLARQTPVYPPPDALEVSQDRVNEKTFFRHLGIPTAPFLAVQTRADLDAALAEIGFPAILKTRRMGYDGKGQFVLREVADAARAWQALAGSGSRFGLVLEGFVPFDRELSQIAVRGRDGEMAFYPLVENHHADGLLRLSLAPAPDSAPLQEPAREYARRVLQALDYVGVLAIEFFQEGERLAANEMAPRVHNSGHWTIEGAETSQFENHLRAVLSLPLGSTEARGPCAMLNLVGQCPETKAVLAQRGAHLHWYGKKPRPGRKVGHITLCGADFAQVRQGVEKLRSLLP